MGGASLRQPPLSANPFSKPPKFALLLQYIRQEKAHKHKLFCPVGLGTTPGLSRGFHRVCPWDKPGENLGQTRVFSLFYTVEARFHRVCPWDKPGLSLGQSRGRRAAQKVYVKKVYVPFSLASTGDHVLHRGCEPHDLICSTYLGRLAPWKLQDAALTRVERHQGSSIRACAPRIKTNPQSPIKKKRTRSS